MTLRCVLFVAIFGCARSENGGARGEDVVAQQPKTRVDVLRSSGNSETLLETALAIANSSDVAELEELVRLLKDADFLNRLDSETEYNFRFESKLRICQVLIALGENSEVNAEKYFVILLGNKTFATHFIRVRVLFAASRGIRNPTRSLFDALEAQVRAMRISLPALVGYYARIQTIETCSRIEKWFKANSIAMADKKPWFTHVFVKCRNDEPIVGLYKRILDGLDDIEMREIVIQTLFDFRPDDWRLPVIKHNDYKPKPRRDASTKALKEVLSIAESCLKFNLSEITRGGVQKACEEIRVILEVRTPEGSSRIAKLMRELDDENFQLREEAVQELMKYGNVIEPMLREALRQELSTEAQLRIRRVLAKLKLPKGR